LLEEMAAAAATGAGQEACAGELADMVVHRLSGKFHAPGDARRGIGFGEGGENLQAERMMQEYGCLGGLADEVELGAG
jgi:hypothetical protein